MTQDPPTADEQLADALRDLSEWKSAHRKLAEMLGATERGRDHCDAMLVICALKRAFDVVDISVTPDASAVDIITPQRCHRIPTRGMEVF
jgi:hypothetical protein